MKQKLRTLSLVLALLTVFSISAAFPSKTYADEESENVAKGKPAYSNGAKNLAALVTDGSADSAWYVSGIPMYVEVDLLSNYDVTKVIVKQPLKNTNVRSYQTAFNVYGSIDGVNFDRIGSMTAPAKATEEGFVFDVTPAGCYRVIRVMSTMSTRGSGSSTYISEVEVYGTESQTPVTPTRNSIEIQPYEEWLLENCGVDLSKIKDENGKYDVKDTYTTEDTVKALEGLVTRILGEKYLSWFEFEVDAAAKGNDYYEISDSNGKIHIKGNEGVSIATGLNYYLKYFCKINVSQETSQVHMPETVIPVKEVIKKESPYEVRYTYNYCTLSYTMSYYGFDEWQRELDYLMLSGINVILDTTATEALWVLYLQNYGYTVQEAIEYVCGYSWKAWWLMGNLESYGGPVSDNWIIDTVEMARVNQRYLSVMGADPCLQAFTGTLPTNFASKAQETLSKQGFENVSKYMTDTGSWSGFTRPYALNTTFPGFDSMAKKFYEVQEQIYGRIGDYYAGDFLHEISSGFNLSAQFNKANMSRSVLDKIIEENNEGVWIIQSWWENPLPDVVEGWGEDRESHILLLDLAAVQSPRWTNISNYGGYEFGGSSWCYCILENYGGRDGAHMNLSKMSKDMVRALRESDHMKGIGLTSEGSERNPVVFDLFWELGWTQSAMNVDDWIKNYAERRYGGTGGNVDAWAKLIKNLYGQNTYDGTTINYSINNYPKFDYTGGYWFPNYKMETYEEILSQLLGEYDKYCDEETYVYDMVELFSTQLSNIATSVLAQMFEAAKVADYDTFHPLKTKYLRIMLLVDELNGFSKNQLLGSWVGRVDSWCDDPRTGKYSDFDRDLMKLDAVILITNWSTLDLGNYAYRQYNGLIKDYYYRMWNNFLTKAEEKIRAGTAITSGSDTLGVSNTVTYYNYGREVALAILNGKEYISEPVPVEGDIYHRSLKEVLTEIQDCFFTTVAVEPNSASLKTDSTLTVSGNVISGKAKGNTAADISSMFSTTRGGKVVFLDGETVVSDETPLTEGMKAVILEDDGSLYDVLNLTIGKITVDPSAAEEMQTFQSKLKGFADAYKSTDLTDFDSAAKQSAAKFIETAIKLSTDSSSYTALKDAVEKIDAAKALISAQTDKVKTKRENLKQELKKDFDALKVTADTLGDRISADSSQLYKNLTDAVTAVQGDESASVAEINAVISLLIRTEKSFSRDAVRAPEPSQSESPSGESDAETPTSPTDTEEKTPLKTPIIIIVVLVSVAIAVIAAIAVALAVTRKKKKN